MRSKGNLKSKIRRVVVILTMIAMAAVFSSANRSAADYRAEGDRLADQGRFPEAIDQYREALLINPRYFEVLRGLASAYFYLEEYDTALDFVRQAKRYGRNDLALLSLEGRILVGTGQFDTAEGILSDVLKREPHNVDASLGLAEISLIRGDYERSFRQFRDALSIAPENRRALLSLVVFHDSRSEWEKGEELLKLALRLYPDDILVNETAALHYLDEGRLDRALYHVNETERIDPRRPETVRLKGHILIASGAYKEGVDLLTASLKRKQDEPLTWYLLALAYGMTGQGDQALQCYEKSLYLAPDDEISRLAAEGLLLVDDSLDEETRQDFSRYHHEQGKRFEQKFLFDRAHQSYRRGVLLDGTWYPGWVLLANLFSKRGFPEKYLDKLLALKRAGAKSPQMDREIERAARTGGKGVADRWKIDQFNLVRPRFSVRIFTRQDRSSLIHHGSGLLLSDYVVWMLEEYPWIACRSGSPGITSFSEAFREAREGGSDYFVILRYVETERTFGCMAELYLARTGTLMDRWPVLRTGNGRVGDVLSVVSDRIRSTLPDRGSLVRIDGDRAILDRGRYHGVKEKDRYVIVRRGRYRLTGSEPFHDVPDSEVLGYITITETDEEISEGKLERATLHDMLNTGDDCFLLTGEEAESDARKTVPLDYELMGSLLKIY